MRAIMAVKPKDRMNSIQALEHPWLVSQHEPLNESPPHSPPVMRAPITLAPSQTLLLG